MVPSMMYQLLNHPEFSKVDLDNLPSVSRKHWVHVSPSEIEKVIKEHPEVADCAVAGVRGASQSDGFVPRAWLVLGLGKSKIH